MPRILVIDDDTRLRNLLGKFLEENNFLVELAKDTQEARDFLNKNSFDLLIIDVMLPNENGIDFTNNFRISFNTPIIMLTARGEPDDRIKGLESGADDYMPKPFEPKELLLRINNILKRHSGAINKNVDNNLLYNNSSSGNGSSGNITSGDILFGEFSFNLNDLRLKKANIFVHLTEGEAKILKILVDNIGKPINRIFLSETLGGVDIRSIDVSINRLRRKIEENPKQPHYLQTVRNFGYILHQ